MSNNYSKYKVGTILVCSKSESVAYKEGKEYQVVEGDFGGNKVKGLKAEDNYFDPFSLICSHFKPLDASQQAVRNLRVVK